MRKILLFLLVVVVVMSATPLFAQARFSIGGFAGLNIPLAQEDSKSGTAFGVKARIVLTPLIGVEPNFTILKNGNESFVIDAFDYPDQERDGGKFTSFGVDLVLGSIQGFTGMNFYGIFGIASAKHQRNGLPDITSASFWGGLGLEYSLSDQLSLEFRGKVLVMPIDGDQEKGSRKNGVITAGLNYYFGAGGQE